jgi:transportin-3
LAAAEQLALRDTLLVLFAHLVAAASSPNASRAVLKQLCMALTSLAIQLDAWADPIADVSNALAANPEMTSILLEFLKVLPQELNGRGTRYGLTVWIDFHIMSCYVSMR